MTVSVLAVAVTSWMQLPSQGAPQLTGQDVAILRVVVERVILRQAARLSDGRTLLVGRTVDTCPTTNPFACCCVSQSIGVAPVPTTLTPAVIPPLNLPGVLQVSADDAADLCRAGWITAINQFFPEHRSIARVSAPVYHEGKAYVYADFACGELCGTGWRVTLSSTEDVWAIERVEPLWMR